MTWKNQTLWIVLLLTIAGENAAALNADVYRLFSLGEVDSIVHVLERRLRTDTTGLPLEQHLLLGLAYAKSHELGKAAEVLEKIWREEPDDQATGLALADVYERSGRLPQAARVLSHLARVDSTSFPVLSRLGLVTLKIGDADSARRVFEKLGRLYSDRSSVHVWRAQCALKVDSLDAARRAYRRAVRLDSLNVAAWLSLARTLLKEDSSAAVIWAADQGLRVSPRHPQLHRLKAEALQRLGRLEMAVVEYLEAQALGDGSAEIYQKLGNCYYALGKTQKARESFARCVQLRPQDPAPYYGLGLCARRQDSLAQAVSWFRTALELALPNYLGELYFQLGDCLARLGEIREAVPLFRKALEYGADKSVVCYALATVYDSSYRDKRPALRAFQEALRYGGLSPEATNYAMKRVEQLKELVHFQNGRQQTKRRTVTGQ